MSQSTEKSLGQVARDAYENAEPWLPGNFGSAWEASAAAVAAVVREQCAQACEQERLPTQPPEHPGDEAYERAITDCVQAIRSMK